MVIDRFTKKAHCKIKPAKKTNNISIRKMTCSDVIKHYSSDLVKFPEADEY
jgi:hypothetical protein